MSVHTWGEDPAGTWTLKITDTVSLNTLYVRQSETQGLLKNFEEHTE